jgi:ribosomal protein S27E
MNIKCNSCDNEAEIFHDEGEFCVQCWNEIKETS